MTIILTVPKYKGETNEKHVDSKHMKIVISLGEYQGRKIFINVSIIHLVSPNF